MALENTIYAGGFEQPVHEAQAVFKSLMDAMARPGTIQTLKACAAPPGPMGAGAGAIAMTLCDHDTLVHLSAPLVEAGIPGWLAFQTGALMSDTRADADFAFIDAGSPLPPLSGFASGSQDYPDRSATVVVEIGALRGGADLILSGPGVDGSVTIAPCGLPPIFADLWRQNNALYPRGIDLVLVAGLELVCLPRTVRIAKGEN